MNPLNSPLTSLPLVSPVPLEEEPEEAVQEDAVLDELRLHLETERSASKAILAAMKELEGHLAGERGKVEELERQLADKTAKFDEMRSHMNAERGTIMMQLNENAELWGQVELLREKLQEERERGFIKRLFSRTPKKK